MADETAAASLGPREAARPDAAELVERAEEALAELDSLPGAARAVATRAVAAVVEVYGEGLGRVVDLVAAEAPELAGPMSRDDLVSHVLLLHGLHPDPLEVRLERALDEVRPLVRDHGGRVALDGIEGDVAVLRVVADGDGDHDGPGLSPVLRHVIEDTVVRLVPELTGIRMTGSALARPHTALIPVEAVRRRPAASEAAS